jgi:P4 family phage/plasmid primase-like protien
MCDEIYIVDNYVENSENVDMSGDWDGNVGDDGNISCNTNFNSLNSDFIKNKKYQIDVTREWTFNEKGGIDIIILNRVVDNYDKFSPKIGCAWNKITNQRESIEGTQTIIKKFCENKNKSKPTLYKPNSKSKKGRHFSSESSLQGLPRPLRHTICREFCKDIDIKNCHPMILVSLCKSYNFACEKINHYINNRDLCLNSLMEWTGWSKDDCKQNVLKLLNGGNIVEIFNYYGVEIPESCQWIKEFKNQITLIHQNITDHTDFLYHKKELIKSNGLNCFNFNGKLVNKVLCEFENILIQHAMHFCELEEIQIIANCFDGLLLKKCDKLNDYFLKRLQEFVVKNVGIPVVFVEKEMDEFFETEGFYTKEEKKILEKQQKEQEKILEKQQREQEKEKLKQEKLSQREENKKQRQLDALNAFNERESEKRKRRELKEENKRLELEAKNFAERLSDIVLADIFIQKTEGYLFFDRIQVILYLYNDETCLYEPLISIEHLKNHFSHYLNDYIESVEPKNEFEEKEKNSRTLDLMNARGINNLLSVVKTKIPDNTQFIMENFNRKNAFPFQDKVVDFNLHYSHENFIRKRRKDDYFTYTTDNEFLYEDYDHDWLIEYAKQLLVTKDEKYVNCFYTLFAHGLTNDNSIKLLIFLIGEGDNGKSAYMNLIKKVYQNAICTDASKTVTKGRGNSCLDTELVMLVGKRVATLSELQKEDSLNISFVKKITGNDRNIMIRPSANSQQIEVIIDPKFYIPTNELPDIPQKDKALLNRFGCFNFCNTFEKSKTKELEILSKRDDLFTYLCILASELTQQKFAFEMCDEMRAYTEQIKSSIDTVKGFVNERIEFTENKEDFIKASDLYERYVSYCGSSDDIEPKNILSQTAFGTKFTKDFKFNSKEKKRECKINKKTCWTYFFIKMKERPIVEELKEKKDIESEEEMNITHGVEESKENDDFITGKPPM